MDSAFEVLVVLVVLTLLVLLVAFYVCDIPNRPNKQQPNEQQEAKAPDEALVTEVYQGGDFEVFSGYQKKDIGEGSRVLTGVEEESYAF